MYRGDFVFVTYWWGRGNLNHNTQRPCPMVVKTTINTFKALLDFGELSKRDIFISLMKLGAITESEADNEVIEIEDAIRMLNKIGAKIVKSGDKYKLVSYDASLLKSLQDENLMKGLIKNKRNVFARLGAQKRGLGYHQNAKSKSLCSYKDCYQFPITLDEMINKWKGKLDKLNIHNYVEEYKTAPRNFPKTKPIKGLYDFRTNQEAMNYKGEFILKMINKFKKPVVYLDGDMLVHKYPDLFDSKDYDFMLRHWSFDPLDFVDKYSFYPSRFETSGGIMYFNNTKRSKDVLKGWIKLNNEIMRKKQPGADDRILTMYLHKSKSLHSCRWLPIPTTYLWLTDKYSMEKFYGKRLPKDIGVVIDHPNCLTTEEMAKDQGAVMNKGGARYPVDYFKYVKGNFMKFPFNNNSAMISNIRDLSYRKRLLKLLKSEKIQDGETEITASSDVTIDKSKVSFMNTKRGLQIKSQFKKNPSKSQFLRWLETKPYTWMASRITIN